jgi:hypothetical protein
MGQEEARGVGPGSRKNLDRALRASPLSIATIVEMTERTEDNIVTDEVPRQAAIDAFIQEDSLKRRIRPAGPSPPPGTR